MKTPKKKGMPDRPPPPPGGRARERLRQFEMERGIEATEATETSPQEECEKPPLAEPSEQKAARKRRRKGGLP